MKKLILIALFFGLSLSVQAELTPKSSNDACLELVKQFVQPKKPRLEVKSGSLFHYDPTLEQKVNKLASPDINIAAFYKSFEQLNHRAPTLKEGVEYVISRKKLVLKSYDDLIVELQARNQNAHMNLPILIKELIKSRRKLSQFKDVEQIDIDLRVSYENHKTNIRDLDIPMELANREKYLVVDEQYSFLKNKFSLGNFQGEYGELVAISVANEKIVARGLTFKPDEGGVKTYSRDIALLVDRLEVNLNQKSEAELIAFVQKYGDGLLRHAQEYITEAPEAPVTKDLIIQKIMTMVRSKEIDVVFVDSRGRYVWGEVKAYAEPITRDTVANPSHQGKKSVYEQLIEHQALAEILGLKQVRFRFIAPLTTVDTEAADLISSLGYEVIYAH